MKGIERGAAEAWRASAAHVVSERDRQLPEAVEQAERVLMLLEAGDRYDDQFEAHHDTTDRDIETSIMPLRDVWIVAWLFHTGVRRAQHPYIFVGANTELRFRAPESWSPRSAEVMVRLSRGVSTRMLMPVVKQ